MIHWVNSHGVEVMVLYAVFSAAISPLPEPTQASNPFYRWFYGFMHGLSLNLDKVAASIKPPIK
jgi:hypothetical protein